MEDQYAGGSPNLMVLREITPILTKFVQDSDKSSDMINYDIDEGTALGFGVFNDGNIAIQRAFMSKDGVFPIHKHEELEILIVYSGKLEVSFHETKDKLIKAPGIVYFNPGEVHCVRALEDSWMIGLTIPTAEGYPDGRQQ